MANYHIQIDPILADDITTFCKNTGIQDTTILNQRVKLTVTNPETGHAAFCFYPQEKIDQFGMDYIQTHAVLTFSTFLNEWIVNLSEDDWYNDIARNPPKTIPVRFIEIEQGTGREIYIALETKRYYLRENHFPAEHFAKWYVCAKRRHTDDGAEPRPNLTFQYNDQTETVIYHDWNGVAAYTAQFNPQFNPISSQKSG